MLRYNRAGGWVLRGDDSLSIHAIATTKKLAVENTGISLMSRKESGIGISTPHF